MNNSHSPALTLYSSRVTFYGRVSFINNRDISGSALTLIESFVYMYMKGNCSVELSNNSAEDVGGAVYIENDNECFYIVESTHTDSKASSNCTINFRNNTARNGGDHIYGTSLLRTCQSAVSNSSLGSRLKWQNLFTFEYPSFNDKESPLSLSAVSSRPTRVCLCNDNGQPACADIDHIFVKMETCPGEVVDIPVVLVGADFGTTIGNIYGNTVLNSSLHLTMSSHQNTAVHPIKSNKECTILKLKMELSDNTHHVWYLNTAETNTRDISGYLSSKHVYITTLQEQIADYETKKVIKDLLKFTPVFINISLLGCPPGFKLHSDAKNSTSCVCYELLRRSINNLRCTVKDHQGYMSWNTTAWIGFDNQNNLIYSEHCFPYYCRREYKNIETGNATTVKKQCLPNREGVLCSKCTKGYSLAIGSSDCIQCSDYRNLSLILFFAVSGFLLVFIIFALNLTVTEGLINGLIFYVNVIWEHQSIASQRMVTYICVFLKPFVAWLNLDFGIETCLVKGLDPYTKTWLQFLFPLYIWTIAALMIVAAHYSTKITNLMGNRALHTLCTLFFLSYSKLFRIIKSIVHITVLTTVYENGTVHKDKVWLWEGERSLYDSSYLALFVFATAIFVFLWMPYTMILTFVQPLRRVSHYRRCRWVIRLSPVFDAYLAPLKHSHHYYFGVLLLTRGFLLLIVLVPSQGLNLHNLMIIVILTLILIHMAIVMPYKSKVVLFFQCFTFGNLIILVSLFSYLKIEKRRYKYWVMATTMSVTLAFVQFCTIVVLSVVRLYSSYCTLACKASSKRSDGDENEPVFDNSMESQRESFSTDYLSCRNLRASSNNYMSN